MKMTYQSMSGHSLPCSMHQIIDANYARIVFDDARLNSPTGGCMVLRSRLTVRQ
jgi:hypothetical protein